MNKCHFSEILKKIVLFAWLFLRIYSIEIILKEKSFKILLHLILDVDWIELNFHKVQQAGANFWKNWVSSANEICRFLFDHFIKGLKII